MLTCPTSREEQVGMCTQHTRSLPGKVYSLLTSLVTQAPLTDGLGKLLAAARPPVQGSNASSPASQLDAQRLAVQVSVLL